MNEKETGISYDRLVEIATRLKDMLKEDYHGSEIVNYLNDEYDLDLTWNEINFIGFYSYVPDDFESDVEDCTEDSLFI